MQAAMPCKMRPQMKPQSRLVTRQKVAMRNQKQSIGATLTGSPHRNSVRTNGALIQLK